MSEHFVYILTNPSQSVLYVGMTSDIARRIEQHRMKVVEGFTKKYDCTRLVYIEVAPDRDAALFREKQIKGWSISTLIFLQFSAILVWFGARHFDKIYAIVLRFCHGGEGAQETLKAMEATWPPSFWQYSVSTLKNPAFIPSPKAKHF
jgi:putative endonuclease